VASRLVRGMERICSGRGIGTVEVFVGDLTRSCSLGLPIYLIMSFVVVAFEESDHYVDAAAVSVAPTFST